MKTNLLTHITEERLPMLLAAINRALNTWDDAPRWLFELADALQAGDVTTDTLWAANTVSTYGVNAEGKLIISAHGHSADPLGAWQTMDAALDFVEAIKLRNVDITPEQLYRTLVGRDYRPSLKNITSVTIANVTDEQLDAMRQAADAVGENIFQEIVIDEASTFVRGKDVP